MRSTIEIFISRRMAFFPQKMLHKVPGSFAGADRRGWESQTFQSYWFYH